MIELIQAHCLDACTRIIDLRKPSFTQLEPLVSFNGPCIFLFIRDGIIEDLHSLNIISEYRLEFQACLPICVLRSKDEKLLADVLNIALTNQGLPINFDVSQKFRKIVCFDNVEMQGLIFLLLFLAVKKCVFAGFLPIINGFRV